MLVFISNDKTWAFKWKWEFGKVVLVTMRLIFKAFSEEIGSLMNKCDNEMHQHFKELHNSVNQYFPNDKCVSNVTKITHGLKKKMAIRILR